MSSWLAKRTGIHINLRPLVRPLAGAAGFMLGGPAGAALGSGLAGGLDDLGHGKNIGQALKGAAMTGGETYLGAKFLPMLAGKLGYGPGADITPGGSQLPEVTPGAIPEVGTTPMSIGRDVLSGENIMAGGYPAAAPGPGASFRGGLGTMAQRAVRSVGSFVKANPSTSLNAAGAAASTYAQASGANADRRLYRDQMMRQNSIEDEERQRRQAIGSAWLQAMAKNGNPMAMDLARQLGYA